MSLLDQLRKRQSEGATPSSAQSIHVRASILFDKKDAAKIELDALYQLALGGLEQLKKLEPRLKPFEATLFSPSAKEFSRELQTKDANSRLDESINTFLALLGPFFLLKPTYKVLEYLIRRYSINEFNKMAIFKCILPYHQNIIFMKMLAIIKLKGTNLWEFLSATLYSGVPPKRSVLVDRMVMDRNLLLFVLNMVKEAVATRTSYKTLQGFYTAMLLEAISTHGLSENMLRDIWPFIIDGLSSQDENYQIGTIMVLSCACWKAAIAPQLVRGAVDSMIAHTLPHLHSNAIRSLIMIVQNALLAAPSSSSPTEIVSQLISNDTISVLATWTDVPQILAGFAESQQYEMTSFLNYLLSTLAGDLHRDNLRASFLFKLFKTLNISEQIPSVIVTLLSSYCNPKKMEVSDDTSSKAKVNNSSDDEEDLDGSVSEDEDDEEAQSQYADRLARLLSSIDLKYPKEMDIGVELMLKNHPDQKKWTELFEHGRHHQVEVVGENGEQQATTLTLCLRQSLPESQMFALAKLVELREEQLKSPKKPALLDIEEEPAFDGLSKLLEKTILDHLKSGNEQLILSALDVPHLGDHVEPNILFATLASLVGGQSSSISVKAFSTVVKLFLNPLDTNQSSNSQTSSTKKAKKSQKQSSSSVYPLTDASVKLMPLILSNLFSTDLQMRSLAAQAALQFQSHFLAASPAVACQHVFSHYSSSIATSLGYDQAVLALATSAVVHNDYAGKDSSWQAILANPRTKMIAVNVLNCALAQISSKLIEPFGDRSVEEECLAIIQVILPHLMEDSQTLLISLDLTPEQEAQFSLPKEQDATSPAVRGIPNWTQAQLESLFSATPYYKREYYFKYFVWQSYNIVEALYAISKSQDTSDHLLSAAHSLFKVIASSQSSVLFAPHIKTLLSFLGSDIQIAHFLEHMWLTTPSVSSAKSQTAFLDEKSAKYPSGLFGSSTSPLVTLRALEILHSLLTVRLRTQQVKGIITGYTQFAVDLVGSLIVPMSHTEASVRLAALSCLHVLSQILSISNSSSDPIVIVLTKFLNSIASKKTEFGLSSSLMVNILENLFNLDEKDSHTPLSRSERTQLHSYLIQKAVSLNTSYAKYSLLYALVPTSNATSLVATSPLLSTLLEWTSSFYQPPTSETEEPSLQSAVSDLSAKVKPVEDVNTYKIMECLIQQWRPNVASVLNSNDSLFEVLILALHSPFEISIQLDSAGAARILGASEKAILSDLQVYKKVPEDYFHFSTQLQTLSMITDQFFANLSSSRQQTLFEHLCELVLSPKLPVKEAVQSVIRALTIDPQIVAQEFQTCVDKTNPPSISEAPPAKRKKPTANQEPPAPVLVDQKWIARVTVLLEMLQYKRDALLSGTHYLSSLFGLLRNTIETENALAKDPSAEYIEQLIFTTITSITQAIANGIHGKKEEPKRSKQDQMDVDELPESGASTHDASSGQIDENLVISLDKHELQELESKYDVDCIVQIIRVRSNPTLQNNALLLLSHIARVYPGRVMSNVMSIFSFMGASTERSDDNYTFNVIEKTVERVIPALLSHAPGVEGRVSASALLAIFVDRLDSIPQHRRLMLFTHILTKVLRRGYLPLVLALLLHKQTQNTLLAKNTSLDDVDTVSRKTSSTEQMSTSAFALTLFNKLSPYECVSAIVYTLYWLNGFDNKLHQSPLVTGRTKELSPIDKANMHGELVQFALSYFTSRTLISQLMELGPEDQQRMQNVYLALFQTLLMFARLVSSDSAASTRSIHCQSKEEILEGVYKLIDKVNELMSIYTFFDVMASLLKQPDAAIKHRALILFNERIKSAAKAEKAGFDFGEQASTTFIQFTVNMFKSIVHEEAADQTNESQLTIALNKQTASISVEIVARLFGNQEQHHSHLIQLSELVVGALIPFTEESSHSESSMKVQASLVVALATLCTSMREKVLPLINKIFPVLLTTLKISIGVDKEKDPRALLQSSCLAAIHVVISVMHRFLSQYWPELFRLLLQPTGIFSAASQWETVEMIMTQIGTLVPARLLLEPLLQTYEYVMQFQAEAPQHTAALVDKHRVPVVKLLAKVAGIVAQSMDRPTLQSYHKQLFRVFLSFFDYSAMSYQASVASQITPPTFQSVTDVEESIISSFMKLTLKLNETMFKPLFLVILDWAQVTTSAAAHLTNKSEPIYTPRTMFFYRLVLTLSEELKAIFVPYFGYMLDHALRVVLQQAQSIKKLDPILKLTGSAFPEMPSGVTGGAIIHHQISLVLNSLQKLFLYDNDSFIDKSRFDKCMPVLVDQLDLSHVEQYKSRVTQSVVPCLAQLAVCVKNESLWKHMNHNVLAKARHTDAQVRFSMLLAVGEFYHRLGEAFLPLLPESVQTLSELMEDSNPDVERQCLLLVRQIEQVLGEEGGVMSLLAK